MCQNEATENEQTEKRIKKITLEVIVKLYQNAKLAEKFLELIKDTLERCHGENWGGYERKIKFSLFFETYDAESFPIGYVGKDVYLLDRKFIHRRFGYFLKKANMDFGERYYVGSFYEERLYARLFQIGILTPYKKSKSKPICTIWRNKGSEEDELEEEQMECICIPQSFVDFDVEKMTVI